MKSFHLKPVDIVYIGDEVRDVEAAKAMGVKIVSVTWGFQSKQILERGEPDYIAEKPKELEKILGGINSFIKVM